MKKSHILSLLIISVAGIIFASRTIIPQQPQFELPAVTPTPESPQTHRDQEKPPSPSAPQTNQSSTPAQTAPAAMATPSAIKPQSQLVRFANPAAKDSFLATNQLSANDLQYYPALQTYLVDRDQIIETPGAQLLVNQRYRVLLTPSDPQTSSQWHFARVNALAAWDSQRGTPSVITAVLDTGFSLDHHDLRNQWAVNTGETGPALIEGDAPNCTSRGLAIDKRCNNIDDDNDSYIDNSLGWDFTTDSNNPAAGQTAPNDLSAGHGTATASLIGAQANNGLGGSGIVWNARLLPIQVMDDTGTGSTLSVALGIHYAVTQGAQVINLSLGSDGDDPLVAEQIQYAISQNVIVVAAAGNNGCNCMTYPARYPGVISVGALTSSNQRASFSSYGDQLDIMAPGTGICASLWSPAQPTSGFSCGLNGTSFSSPLVAGAASLLRSQNPNLSAAQIASAMTSTATKLSAMSNANWTATYGFGLLNIGEALRSVSLAQPTGKPVSTGVVILSQLTNPTTFVTESMTSACRTTLTEATCRIQLVNPSTNHVIVIAESSPTGINNLLTAFTAANISPGDYVMQAQVFKNNGWSIVGQSNLRVVP